MNKKIYFDGHAALESIWLREDYVRKFISDSQRKELRRIWNSEECYKMEWEVFLYKSAIEAENEQILINSLNQLFLEIALKSSSPADFINQARKIQNVPSLISEFFTQKFGTEDGKKVSMESASKNYLEYAISKFTEKASPQALRYYIDVLGFPLPF